MGKRELLIAVAFLVVGTLAFQLSAPASADGEGFSFSRLWSNFKNHMRGPVSGSATVAGTLPVTSDVREIRVLDAIQGMKIVGEARTDVSYELTVRAYGPDEKAAAENAKRGSLAPDNVGETLTLRVKYPDGTQGRSYSSLVLHVPSRLNVRLAGSTTGLTISDVASLQVDALSGLTSIRDVGTVGGAHRNGELNVTGVAGLVKFRLQQSIATFSKIEKGLTLEITGGSCFVDDSQGPLELDAQRTNVRLTRHNGTIRVGGGGGQIFVDSPKSEVKVDVLRSTVTVVLKTAVPVTVMTSEENLRLQFTEPPKISIDALATAGGKIVADDFQLLATVSDDDQKLMHKFGDAGAPQVTLRNQRGTISITKPGPTATPPLKRGSGE